MRRFNVTGLCLPDKHYMANISDKVAQTMRRGEASHEAALEQITGYLNNKGKDTGYLLTFDFRKENNTGKPRIEWVELEGKRILDVMVGV